LIQISEVVILKNPYIKGNQKNLEEVLNGKKILS
jgi:hypothetical protein